MLVQYNVILYFIMSLDNMCTLCSTIPKINLAEEHSQVYAQCLDSLLFCTFNRLTQLGLLEDLMKLVVIPKLPRLLTSLALELEVEYGPLLGYLS